MEAPPVRRSTRIKNDLSIGQSLVEKGSEPQFKISGQEVADSDARFDPCVQVSEVLSGGKKKSVSGEDCGKHEATSKKPGRSTTKTKVRAKSNGKSYSLMSSENGARVLRSKSIVKEAPIKLACTNHEIPVRENKKKKKRMKSVSRDEFAVIRNRLRYSLTRINYEQNLLDAYSGEGWRGQSLEKIRPEKELERAKSEILRCKLKIRELFHHLCSLLSDGRLEEPLFDSEGEISCEDIFCAKCHSKNLSVDNDIILCDGICDRGFHQKCLNPPLLSEDIPPGDEGWLCPGCDCKVDCIDLLNEFLGGHLEVEDSWEKVFPEASVVANEDQKYDSSGLPSDDSDGDYNPDILVSDAENEEEGSTSEGSVFASSSEDLENTKNNENDIYFGLPSEDSEDDDYEPDKKGPDGKIQKDESGSDESDFTSDSDEFIAEICQNDSSASLLPEPKPHDEEGSTQDGNEPEPNLDNILPVSKGKQQEHLDYKKKLLESFQENELPDREKKENLAEELGLTVQQITRWFANARHNKRHSGNKEIGGVVSPRTSSRNKHLAGLQTPDKKLVQIKLTATQSGSDISAGTTENTSQLGLETLDKPPTGFADLQTKAIQPRLATPQPCSTKGERLTKTTSTNKEHLKEKLLEALSEKQYPSRQEKEELAKKLGITVHKVSKWFSNARHSMKHSAKVCKLENVASTGINSSGTKNPDNKAEDDATRASIKAQKSCVPGNGGVIENSRESGFITSDMEPAGALKPGMTMHIGTLETVSADPTSPMKAEASLVESKEEAIVPHPSPDEDSILSGSADNLRPKSVAGTDRRKRPNLAVASMPKDTERQKAIARELRRRKLR